MKSLGLQGRSKILYPVISFAFKPTCLNPYKNILAVHDSS